MHQETGEIREEKDIPKVEKKKWAGVLPAMAAALSAMAPEERVTQLRQELSSGKQQFFRKATLASPESDSKRKNKRKSQKLSRRRNRK